MNANLQQSPIREILEFPLLNILEEKYKNNEENL